jgi:hypothetical protein
VLLRTEFLTYFYCVTNTVRVMAFFLLIWCLFDTLHRLQVLCAMCILFSLSRSQYLKSFLNTCMFKNFHENINLEACCFNAFSFFSLILMQFFNFLWQLIIMCERTPLKCTAIKSIATLSNWRSTWISMWHYLFLSLHNF